MTTPMKALTGLLTTDALISNSFFLEIDSNVITSLSGVSGLDIEVDVVSGVQVGASGLMQNFKTLGNQTKVGDLTLTRLAPLNMAGDAMWTWFNTIRDAGLGGSDRTSQRKNGSIVVYDTANAEQARYNFFNGWPSKISTDALSADGNDAVKETITLTIERLTRIK